MADPKTTAKADDAKKDETTSSSKPETPVGPTKLRGSTGTSIFAGYLDEEYLTALKWPAAYDTYDEMRRGDSQIRMVLSAVKNPIRSANFRHEPIDDSEKAKEVADFLDWNWFRNPFFKWSQVLSEWLTYLDFGHSVSEYTFKAYDHRNFGMVHCLGAMAFRKQDTIETWKVDGTNGLQGIEQIAFGDTVDDDGKESRVFMPADSLVIFVNEQEGDNWQGLAILRGCYGPWFRKKHLLKMNAIGAEKAAIGVPVGLYPMGANEAQRAEFEGILQDFAVHESSYLFAPAGFEFDVVKLDFDSSKLMESVYYEDAQMSRSVLFHFLELGQNGSGGSFALGSDLSDLALSAIQYVADGICANVRSINERLVEANFGDPDLCPDMVSVGINQKAGKELAETLKSLIDAGALTPDPRLEAHLRDTYNLPEADPEEEEEAQEVPDPENPDGNPETGEENPENEGEEEGETPENGPNPAKDSPGSNQNPAKKKAFTDPDLTRFAARFLEPAAEWTPFRELTQYEAPLALAETAREFRGAQARLSSLMRARLGDMSVYALRQLEKRFAQKPRSRTQTAARLQIDPSHYETALLRGMARIAADGVMSGIRDMAAKTGRVEFAEKDDKKAIRADLAFLPKQVQDVLKAQAKKQAETQAAELKKIIDFQVQEADASDLSDDLVISQIEDELNAYIDSPRVHSAGLTVAAQSYNRGRNGFFFDDDAITQIQAFQYSAVIDGATTDICLSLDGKIFKPNDPEASKYRPPNHHGCRSILVPITLNEAKPEVTGLEADPTNETIVREYEKRGKPVPDLAKIKKSRNL